MYKYKYILYIYNENGCASHAVFQNTSLFKANVLPLKVGKIS